MTHKHTDLQALAARAVTTFEAVPNGEPYAAPRDAARAALNALRDNAVDQLSTFEPWGADVNADFDRVIDTAKRQDLAALLVEIMPRCLDSHPKLARFLVSPPVLELVRSCNDLSGDSEREYEIQLSYLQAQSAHLVGRAEYEPAATILVESVGLAERCQVAEERLERHARAERERIDQEQRDAAEALAQAERSRRATVAAFFSARSGLSFVLRGRVFSGAGLSQSVDRGAPLTDQGDGEFVTTPSLDELELAMKRAQAAEAVTV